MSQAYRSLPGLFFGAGFTSSLGVRSTPILFGAVVGAVLLQSCCTPVAKIVPATKSTSPAQQPIREFRGLWVATVDNIDWPSSPNLSSDAQQAELIRLFDRAAGLHVNAVLLQVRPGCDALYASTLEPWSAYLTGTAGQPPNPFYDPLTFAIQQAHLRGMQLHAWINPFRVRTAKGRQPAAPRSVQTIHPDWVCEYGDVTWLDPGRPEARDHSLAVAADITRRYDVDGIHIDDYFYPYPQKDHAGREIPFSDGPNFARYGNGQSLADWRRSNINDFVRRLYLQTKAIKPNVQVGISPFGIYRPGDPPQIQGFDPYEKLYADSKLWLREGWADYFCPQLYWPIDRTAQSFPVLLNWWQQQNVLHRRIWPGLNCAAKGATPTEIEYEIRTTRGFGCEGQVLFGARGLLENNPALYDHLVTTVYSSGAVMPR